MWHNMISEHKYSAIQIQLKNQQDHNTNISDTFTFVLYCMRLQLKQMQGWNMGTVNERLNYMLIECDQSEI